MKLRNDPERYGLVAISLHRVVAALTFFLFGLGLYMTSLTYYDPLYRTLPALHKAVGVVMVTLVTVRIAWRLFSPPPPPIAPLLWERRAARAVHTVLYLLPFALFASGDLIATADGRPLMAFGIELLPSTFTGEHLEDTAGAVHLALAIALMALVGLHAAAALKHHFHDHDRTLIRILDIGK